MPHKKQYRSSTLISPPVMTRFTVRKSSIRDEYHVDETHHYPSGLETSYLDEPFCALLPSCNSVVDTLDTAVYLAMTCEAVYWMSSALDAEYTRKGERNYYQQQIAELKNEIGVLQAERDNQRSIIENIRAFDIKHTLAWNQCEVTTKRCYPCNHLQRDKP